MSWVNLDSMAAIATIVAAVPVVAGGIAIVVPKIRSWLADPARPWAIPLFTAVATSAVTTAIVVASLGAIGPAGPPGKDGAQGPPAISNPDLILPAGAVVAFDRSDLGPDTCPSGWKPFGEARARVIIGAGDPALAHSTPKDVDIGGHQLQGYPFRFPGGELNHQLTVAELPAHSHGIKMIAHSEYLRGTQGYAGLESVGRDASASDPGGAVRSTEPAGENKPFNIMPPFIALYFCKRD